VELDEIFFVEEAPVLSGIEALVTVLLIADDDPDGWTMAEDEEAPAPYEWIEEAPVPYEWAEETPVPYEWAEDTPVPVCFDVIADVTPVPTILVDDETPVPLILVDDETPVLITFEDDETTVPEIFEDETPVLMTALEEAFVVEIRVLEGLEDGLAEDFETGTVPTVLIGTPDAPAARDGPRGKHLLIGVINLSFW
jgi:hypothetical protein